MSSYYDTITTAAAQASLWWTNPVAAGAGAGAQAGEVVYQAGTGAIEDAQEAIDDAAKGAISTAAIVVVGILGIAFFAGRRR